MIKILLNETLALTIDYQLLKDHLSISVGDNQIAITRFVVPFETITQWLDAQPISMLYNGERCNKVFYQGDTFEICMIVNLHDQLQLFEVARWQTFDSIHINGAALVGRTVQKALTRAIEYQQLLGTIDDDE